jgi:uncharacterized protein YjbI with pentapeptide repeats
MPRTTFKPDVHGFKFYNSFINQRFVGPIQIVTKGRCGGMVYTALDFYFSHLPIPPDLTLPAEGSLLSTYISERQDNSLMNPLAQWAELFFNPFGWRTAEFFHWGLPSQTNPPGHFSRLKACIDLNKPVPLGLFEPGDGGFKAHHQVLAIGYETGAGDGDLRIQVYDPNHPLVITELTPATTRYRFVNSADGNEYITYLVDETYRPRIPNLANPCGGVATKNWAGQNHSGQTFNQQDFNCALFTSTNFTGCTMMQTDFSFAKAERASFYGANLRNSNFSNAKLRYAVFFGADLKAASLSGADATGASFVGADMQRVTAGGCRFANADLHGANLANAELVGANFAGANLYGADLRGSILSNSDFRGANLTGANLAGANKSGALGLP